MYAATLFRRREFSNFSSAEVQNKIDTAGPFVQLIKSIGWITILGDGKDPENPYSGQF
jgi:hypothetical protein